MRVFIKTGPGHDDCDVPWAIAADLIESGSMGTPHRLEEHLRQVIVMSPSGRQENIFGLDVLYTLRSKFGAFQRRQLDRDLSDIKFLLSTYLEEVRVIVDKLEPEAVELFLQSISADSEQEWRDFFGL
ncbi:MAG: AAA ATPase cdc48 [Chaenotheca gracillima]|nr:MAG: AAA ATPase cdc48 [Chaenotheca gracillima]